MGSDHSKVSDPHFYDKIDIARYKSMRPNLSETEIKQIYRMFDTYNPKNGLIKSGDLVKKYRGGPECEDLLRLADKERGQPRVHRL